MTPYERKEDQARRIRAVAAVLLAVNRNVHHSVYAYIRPDAALREAARAVYELDRLPVPDESEFLPNGEK